MPRIYRSHIMSCVFRQKAAEALKASTVKIAGRDVLGTWKVMVAAALLPLCFFIYPLIAAIVGWFKGWGAIHTWAYFALLQPFIMYGSVRFVGMLYVMFIHHIISSYVISKTCYMNVHRCCTISYLVNVMRVARAHDMSYGYCTYLVM